MMMSNRLGRGVFCMKGNVRRSDLKYNFLKKVIIRLDYTGVLDSDLEETVKNIKDFLFSCGFVNLKEGYINEIDFDIKDPELIETQLAIPINELKKNKSYIFSTENSQQTVQITKFYALISVDFEKYIKFEVFQEIFSKMVKIIKENNKFLRMLRLGLRKINSCILLDLMRLNDYFDEKYFNNIVKNLNFDGFNINIMNSRTIDSFTINNRNVNYIRYITQGVLNNNDEPKEAYQVVLDIDVYIRDKDRLKMIFDNEENLNTELVNINTLLFELYIHALKDDFIQQLIHTGVDENIILGVTKND